MNHLGTRLLETSRLLLRPFTVEDAQAMYDNWASDENVTKFLTWPTHASPAASQAVLQEWVSHYPEKEYYQWAITLKSNGTEPIGSIAVVKIDNQTKTVQVGYCIGQKWWNQGITSEALHRVIDYFFCLVGANRVEARHDPNNPVSGHVMVKCGMQYEGTLQQADWNNQGVCDYAMYAILRQSYLEAVFHALG